MYIGQTGEDILNQLQADTTWANAKRKLVACLEDGSQEEEA